jgi:hypothetical protein
LWDTEIGRVLTISAYDAHLEQLFEVMNRVTAALRRAGVEYRVVGGLAVFLHVAAKDPLAARATRDIDIAVDRNALAAIGEAVRPFGFEIRRAAGVDMLVDAAQPSARSAVHLIFVSEKVRPEYVEAVPGFSVPAVTAEGVLLAPVADLVRMKLTSYRLKDRVHVQDLDAAGLITADIEADLPPLLRDRLAEIRACE